MDENKDQYLEEALSLAVQTHDTVLGPFIKSALYGEDKTAILEKLNQVATQSDKGWVKDLEERGTANKEAITSLLIDAAMGNLRRLLGDFDVFLCHNANDKLLCEGNGRRVIGTGYSPLA